jgi:hypothetical protein
MTGIGSISPPYTPLMDTVPPRRHALMAVCSACIGRWPSVGERLSQAVRQQPDRGVCGLAHRRAVRLHADRPTTASGPRPPVIWISSSADSSTLSVPPSTASTPYAAASARALGTGSTPITRSTPWCRAMRQASCPTGPRPEHGQRAVLGTSA